MTGPRFSQAGLGTVRVGLRTLPARRTAAGQVQAEISALGGRKHWSEPITNPAMLATFTPTDTDTDTEETR